MGGLSTAYGFRVSSSECTYLLVFILDKEFLSLSVLSRRKLRRNTEIIVTYLSKTDLLISSTQGKTSS